MDLESLRKYCLSMPGATEDIKWGHDLCFSVVEKMFCVTGVDGDSHTSFKVTDEEFEELTARPGIIPAPYMARNKWVAVQDLAALSHDEWKRLVKQSYELIVAKLPKKVQETLKAGR
jgi:predicted DNA-binding protein (MmcQ/YjbR family)